MDGCITATERQQLALYRLKIAVEDAVAYFNDVDEGLHDGDQNAHDVLAHLVFWQCEHITVLEAMLQDAEPALRSGTLRALSAQACEDCKGLSMADMVYTLNAQHGQFAELLCQLSDWDVDFPIKQGGLPSSVEDRVIALMVHIDQHVAQLRRAELLSRDGVSHVGR